MAVRVPTIAIDSMDDGCPDNQNGVRGSMARVVINADDFGLTDGVTRGIVQAIQQGSVTSTTAMACVPGAAERLRQWAHTIPHCIGAHLQLTTGRPLSDPSIIPTLCGPDGNFHADKRRLIYASSEEILIEWEAQFEFLRGLGIKPTHIDTHHHVHKFPNVFDSFCTMAQRFNIPARALTFTMRDALNQAHVPCPDRTLLGFYGDALTLQALLTLATEAAQSLPDFAVVEIMCHPGFSCDELASLSKYTHQRDHELETLCSPILSQQLKTQGTELCSYEALRGVLI